MHRLAALLLVCLAAGCASDDLDMTYTTSLAAENISTAGAGQPAPLDPSRPVDERDCSRPIEIGGGNLRCR